MAAEIVVVGADQKVEQPLAFRQGEDVGDGRVALRQAVEGAEAGAAAAFGDGGVESGDVRRLDRVAGEAAAAQIAQPVDGFGGFGALQPVEPHRRVLQEAFLAAVEIFLEAAREGRAPPVGIGRRQGGGMGAEIGGFRFGGQEQPPVGDGFGPDRAQAQHVVARQDGADAGGERSVGGERRAAGRVDHRRGIVADAEIGGFQKPDALDAAQDQRQDEGEAAVWLAAGDDDGRRAPRRRQHRVECAQPERMGEGAGGRGFEETGIVRARKVEAFLAGDTQVVIV